MKYLIRLCLVSLTIFVCASCSQNSAIPSSPFSKSVNYQVECNRLLLMNTDIIEYCSGLLRQYVDGDDRISFFYPIRGAGSIVFSGISTFEREAGVYELSVDTFHTAIRMAGASTEEVEGKCVVKIVGGTPRKINCIVDIEGVLTDFDWIEK